MTFLLWHLTAAYVLDLLLGDPPRWPHPVRWIGRLVAWLETLFYDEKATPILQRLGGFVFWIVIVVGVMSGTLVAVGFFSYLHPAAGDIVVIWLAYSTLATRSLHKESSKVAEALQEHNLVMARERLSWLVSRDTSRLDETGVIRGLIETVSENISDGIVAPLFYLALGGPVGAIVYKCVNTMDSMVGYTNGRYRYFGWFAARADDAANWIPARLSGLLIMAAAACLKQDWRGAWRVMRRDARKMESPNAGYPEAAAAGALNVQLGGSSVYFGEFVEKPLLGDPIEPLTLHAYRSMIRLTYVTSFFAFILALAARALFM